MLEKLKTESIERYHNEQQYFEELHVKVNELVDESNKKDNQIHTLALILFTNSLISEESYREILEPTTRKDWCRR